MAFANNMSHLLNKIERRLGVSQINLPPEFSKDKWVDVIKDSITTFSRYFPHRILYTINRDTAKCKDGYYIIDESQFPGSTIIGVKDIYWDDFDSYGVFGAQSSALGIYDIFANPFPVEEIASLQLRADQLSLYNSGIYVEFEQPNKIKLVSSMNNNISPSLREFKVELFVEHSTNLNTIPPTMMETFEALALCDVADFLYNGLKYYDGLETVYATIDLKLGDIQNIASNRDTILQEIKDGYVSMANTYQPAIYTI